MPGALSCPSRSTGYGISGDGTTVVGLSWIGCNARGFRWTAGTGMLELLNLAQGNNRASTISRDGTAMAGFARGTFNCTPAYWAADTTDYVLNSSYEGEVYGFNNDGSVIVGYDVQGLARNAWVWTSSDGMISLNNRLAALDQPVQRVGRHSRPHAQAGGLR